MEMNPLLSFLLAFVATMAFAILFQAPRSTLPCSGFVGALGWVIFVLMSKNFEYSTPVANFCATVLLAAAGELSARIFKQPSTVYIIPGIIPLVPGLGMYQGMAKLIAKNYEAGMSSLLGALLDSIAIALGLMMVTSIFRIFKMRKKEGHL